MASEMATLPTCQICGDDIVPAEKVIRCPACDTLHHQECWIYNEGCSTFGCEETPEDWVPEPRRPRRSLRRRGSQTPIRRRDEGGRDQPSQAASIIPFLAIMGWFDFTYPVLGYLKVAAIAGTVLCFLYPLVVWKAQSVAFCLDLSAACLCAWGVLTLLTWFLSRLAAGKAKPRRRLR